MALPDSGDVARMRRIIARLKSYGVTVREMPGWETRGFQYPSVPTRIFDHHDASSRKSGEWGSLGLILDGTPRGIPGPLSNFQVARALDGVPKVAIVAAGYTYHAGTGGPWNELAKDNANPHTYGTEKANDGLGEPYTAAANYATNALFHAAAVESGRVPESFPLGHKEWTTRKSDPLYAMSDRRRQVAAFTPSPQEDELPITPQEISAISDAVANRGIGVYGAAWQTANAAAAFADAANKGVGALAVKVDALAAKVAQPSTAAEVKVDAAAVASALAANADFINALSKAVNDDAARRMTS